MESRWRSLVFQKWFPLKCISWMSLGISFFLSQAQAQHLPLPKILKEIEKIYSQSKTISAQFSQVNENAALSSKKMSQGTLLIKLPSKIRWETKSPDSNLLVSDGHHFWFYTPPFETGEMGQVIQKKSSEVQTQLATALLAGSFSSQNLTIRQESPFRFSLTPKPGSAGTVIRVILEINPTQKRVQKVNLEHQGGNRTEITLSEIELGVSLKDELFFFKPPPHTESISD